VGLGLGDGIGRTGAEPLTLTPDVFCDLIDTANSDGHQSYNYLLTSYKVLQPASHELVVIVPTVPRGVAVVRPGYSWRLSEGGDV